MAADFVEGRRPGCLMDCLERIGMVTPAVEMPVDTFDEWAIVDVMGHQRYVGRVTEQVIAGCGFVRVDVPKTDKQPPWSKLIGTGSIYAITPVSEDIAKAMANRRDDTPVQAFELTPRMTAQASIPFDDHDEDDEMGGPF